MAGRDGSDADTPRYYKSYPGKLQQLHHGIDSNYTRFPTYPDEAEHGIYDRSVLRPAYARFLLNRFGGSGNLRLNIVAEATKTPWIGQYGAGNKTWLRVPNYIVPQHHKTALPTTPQPGPFDVLAMKSYGQSYSAIKSRLASALGLLGVGGSGGS